MSETPITGYTKAGADSAFAAQTALTGALPDTVGTSGQVLKSTGTAVTWQADANTTYTAATQAEIENAASTTGRLVTGQRMAQGVAAFAPVKTTTGTLVIPQPPAEGTFTLAAVDGVLTWTGA